jgi:outer membrane protein assembly factor BamB
MRERESARRDGVAYPPLFDAKRMIIADPRGTLEALDDGGKAIWTYPLLRKFDPGVSSIGQAAWTGNRIYVNDGDELVALDVDNGVTLARVPVKESDPVNGVAIDGALITPYLLSKNEYHVGRFEPQLTWSVPTDDATATLAAADDLCVYQPEARRIAALDIAAGGEKWRASVDGVVVSTPAIWNGGVYLGIRGGIVQCLELASGKQRWRREIEIDNPSNIIVDPAGVVELCIHPWHITFDAATGSEIRRHNFERAIQDFRISMVLDMDLSRTHLWAADHFGTLFAMHRQSGRIDWVHPVQGRIPAAHHPVIRGR